MSDSCEIATSWDRMPDAANEPLGKTDWADWIILPAINWRN